MSKVICKGKYTSDIGYFLRAVEYGGEKIQTQKIHFNDGRILDVQDDTMIDFSKYDVREIEKISFVLKDSEKQIDISVEKYQEKILQDKTPIMSSNVIEIEDLQKKGIDNDSKADVEFLGYLDYTGNRLGAEKESGTGLFGIGGNISIETATDVVNEAYDNGVRIFWMDIISISREDGDRLGFNNRQAWKDLIISKAPEIAKAYNIPFENFKMYAALHTNHPNSYHVHLNFHSSSSSDGYIKNGPEGGFEKACEKVKSLVVNSVFQDDVADMKKLINTQRKEISQLLNKAMNNEIIGDKLNNSFLLLAEELRQYKSGKLEYGYLKSDTKRLVTNVLKDISEKDGDFKQIITEYFRTCEQQVRVYAADDEKVQARLDKMKKRFFEPEYHSNDKTNLQNTIIKFAAEYNDDGMPSDSRATKEKLEFYSLPQENASESFSQAEDKRKQLFEEIFLFDKHSGASSTVLYMAKKHDTVMAQIQATKKKMLINSMCRAVIHIISDATQGNRRKTNSENEKDNNLSKNQGAFTNKREGFSESF